MKYLPKYYVILDEKTSLSGVMGKAQKRVWSGVGLAGEILLPFSKHKVLHSDMNVTHLCIAC